MARMGKEQDENVEQEDLDLDELVESDEAPEEDEKSAEPEAEISTESETPVPPSEKAPKETKPKQSVAQEKNDWRRRARRAERELAEFQAAQEIAVAPEKPPGDPVVSPLDQWFDANKDDPDAPLPASILRSQRQFEQQQRQQRVHQEAAETQHQALVRSIAVAKRTYTEEAQGENLDFSTVTTAGIGLLSEADKRMIQTAGEQAGEELYGRCVKRLKDVDSEDGDMIRSALRARRQTRREHLNSSNEKSKSSLRKERVPTPEEVLQRSRSTRHPYLNVLGLDYSG